MATMKTISSGFFNSVNGDRTYNAEQLSQILVGVVEEGIFEGVDGKFAVTRVAETGTGILIDTGRAYLLEKWIYNDAQTRLDVEEADATNPRWDAVVIRVLTSTTYRYTLLAIRKGEASANPVKPTINSNERCIAFLRVSRSGTGSSSTTVIDTVQNQRGKAVSADGCPYAATKLRLSDATAQAMTDGIATLNAQMAQVVYFYGGRDHVTTLPTNTSLNSVQDSGTYYLNSNNKYTNMPGTATWGHLRVSKPSSGASTIVQEFFTTAHYYWRVMLTTNNVQTWYAWQHVEDKDNIISTIQSSATTQKGRIDTIVDELPTIRTRITNAETQVSTLRTRVTTDESQLNEHDDEISRLNNFRTTALEEFNTINTKVNARVRFRGFTITATSAEKGYVAADTLYFDDVVINRNYFPNRGFLIFIRDLVGNAALYSVQYRNATTEPTDILKLASVGSEYPQLLYGSTTATDQSKRQYFLYALNGSKTESVTRMLYISVLCILGSPTHDS